MERELHLCKFFFTLIHYVSTKELPEIRPVKKGNSYEIEHKIICHMLISISQCLVQKKMKLMKYLMILTTIIGASANTVLELPFASGL